MSTTKIMRPWPVTGADCGSIAITAAEGGIGYWAVIDKYDPDKWCTDPFYMPTDVDDGFVFYTITPSEYLDESEWLIRVTPALIKDGIRKFWSRLNGLDFDAIELDEMDANEADMVIQLGAFGEVVYG